MSVNIGISIRTVEFHKYRMMETFSLHAKAALVHFAFEHDS